MNQEIRVRVEAALQALKRGELIILSDDSQREHEGDLVGLASFATTQSVSGLVAVCCVHQWPLNVQKHWPYLKWLRIILKSLVPSLRLVLIIVRIPLGYRQWNARLPFGS